jgi:zinc D-Ala-D-Ala carboxypeptidase
MDIARHFTLDELKHSNTAKAEGIPNEPGPAEIEALRALCAAVLDPLREALGKPIRINCAYRGPVLNKRVGGVANSQHLTGQAADLQSSGASVLDVFKLIIRQGLPYDQVIYEAKSATSKWVHVSHVNGANRSEIRVAKFGPDGKPQSYPLISKEVALAMSEPLLRDAAPALTYEEGEDEPVLLVMAPKPAIKKAATKKVAAKKLGAKPVLAKKVPAKKAPAKQAAAKRVAAKKPAAKKPAAKVPARKSTQT